MKRRIIQYNPQLKERARKLRKNMTLSEVILWSSLKNGQMMGYDFDRQRPIGNYIVDFYCKDLQLALEVDGKSHDEEMAILKDKQRQEELETLGIRFLRFNALLVVDKIESVIKEIERWILSYKEKNGVSMVVSRKRSKKNPTQIFKETSVSISPLQGGEVD